jgi:hypothetical protein
LFPGLRGHKQAAFSHPVKGVGKLNNAVPRPDILRIAAFHAAQVVGELRRDTPVDLPV